MSEIDIFEFRERLTETRFQPYRFLSSKFSFVGPPPTQADARGWDGRVEKANSQQLEKGCEDLSLDRETELKTPKRSDLRRAAIAWAIWKQSSVSQEWIAEKLGMKSRQNVSQRIRRFDKLPERDLPRELRNWRQ